MRDEWRESALTVAVEKQQVTRLVVVGLGNRDKATRDKASNTANPCLLARGVAVAVVCARAREGDKFVIKFFSYSSKIV